MKLIPANEKPRSLNVTSLQLEGISFNASNNFDLFNISLVLIVHPEYSLKILFSIPKWYPDIRKLNIKVINVKINNVSFL